MKNLKNTDAIKNQIYEYIKTNNSIVAQAVSNSTYDTMTAGMYFTTRFNTLPSRVIFNNIIQNDLIAFLEKDNWFLLQDLSSYEKKTEDSEVLLDPDFATPVRKGINGSFQAIWIKDKYFIHIISEASTICEVRASYDSTDRKSLDYLKNTILKFAKKEKLGTPSFYLLTKTVYNELDLRRYDAKVPENMNLELNYGSNFLQHSETIKNKLSTIDQGLYILHGEPGTGKSTFIKWLSTTIKKKFIYVPEFMVPMINDPAVMRLFMNHTDSILVLEDAEKLIAKRDDSSDSMASLILNLTDGILADIMKLSVIITYNTASENIDQALLRKGRLQYIYEFKPLEESDINKIMINHGLTEDQIADLQSKKLIKDKMTLADIYNIYDKNGINVVKSSQKPFGFDKG